MKNKLIAAGILVVAGIGFIIASQQFATPAHAAPGGSIIEVVFATPSLTFAFAGSAMVIIAVIAVSVVLMESKD